MVDSWQPIETAPKTGMMLACEAGEGEISYEVWSCGQYWTSLNWDRDNPYPLGPFPTEEARELTHWMPLPDPPRASKEGQSNV